MLSAILFVSFLLMIEFALLWADRETFNNY